MTDATKGRIVALTDAEIWALRNALENSIETTGEQDADEASAYQKLIDAQDKEETESGQ